MAILIKGMEMPDSCGECPLHDGQYGWCNANNDIVMSFDERPRICPLVEVPDEQPDRNAQERYEDLCEYFKDCHDKGIGILGDRKEFKAWLERVHWHVVKCDELGRELEKLQSAQPEIIRCKDCKWWDKYSDTHGYCLAAKHGYWSEHWEISIRRTYDADWYCADAERRADESD